MTDEASAPAPEEEPPASADDTGDIGDIGDTGDAPRDEAKEKARAAMIVTLRTLIHDVCVNRFGAFPPEVAAVVAEEKTMAYLQSWYIAAGTRAEEDFIAFVISPPQA